ncbi:MAG TPA: ATP-binding protein [Caulobacteraceae bacterium]|nr:ATP-binding protein [Caulobacteraceae bacterium]
MPSRPSTASATATANRNSVEPETGERRAAPERALARARRTWGSGSRLGRLIVVLNLLGLAVLVGGSLVLNELRQGLINAQMASLSVEGDLIANVIDQTATVGDPQPALEADRAADVIESLLIPRSQRLRLFDAEGHVLADSWVLADRVESAPLPPARKPGQRPFRLPSLGPGQAQLRAMARRQLAGEVAAAMRGDRAARIRVTASGARVVSVSIPIRHVEAVLGVLTLEAGNVDQIVAAQRAALLPFILIAVAVTLLSSLILTQLVSEPVLRLARAADRVRLSRARTIALPDLARRDDELGDLTRSLEDMTHALSDRMEAIERFAADVAHELRNPMTSIGSAVETLPLVKTDAARERLLKILSQDVRRLERLITDISNASRLDAELAREIPAPMDLARLLSDICSLYEATARRGEAGVRFLEPAFGEPLRVAGREGPLGQVFRNLIDNARSFSPPGGNVRVRLQRTRAEAIASVEDDGPGIPPENLETVFERFYTSRPKGAAFGGNSGLGLAIARQIVQAHGGRIWAENRTEAGRISGARFVVALPLA